MYKPLAGGGPQYAISLTFDDGTTDHYTEAYTYMASKGLYKATTYAISAQMDTGGNLTTAQAQTMYNAGWDIGNHTNNSEDLTTLTQAEIEATLTTCKNYLDNNNMPRGGTHVAYPFGKYDADSDAAMAALGYDTGRLAGNDITLDLNNPPDYRRIPSISVSGQEPNTLKSWIYDAVLYGLATIILFHKIDDVDGYPVDDFKEFIDWIAERGYTLSTISELHTMVY